MKIFFLLPLPVDIMPCSSSGKRDSTSHGFMCESIKLCPLPMMTLIQSFNTNPMEKCAKNQSNILHAPLISGMMFVSRLHIKLDHLEVETKSCFMLMSSFLSSLVRFFNS